MLDSRDIVRAGNGTLEAFQAAGGTEVLVVEPEPGQLVAVKRKDWSRTEAIAYAVADNRIGDLATYDNTGLAEVLRGLESEQFDLAAVGFTGDEIDALCESLGTDLLGGDGGGGPDPGPQIDRAAELQAKWGTAHGQLWTIPSRTLPGAQHRLLCGDGTDVGTIDRVGPALVAILDPPFDLRDEKWVGLIRDPSIVFGQARHVRRIPDSLWRFERIIVKATGHRGASVQVFHRHAFVAQCGTEKTLPTDKTATLNSVIEATSPETVHPYEKPVSVLVEHLTHWTPAGDIIDHFAGSGGSFVAAEQTGRLCRGIEIDPKYVAVTLERLSGMDLKPQLTEPETA